MADKSINLNFMIWMFLYREMNLVALQACWVVVPHGYQQWFLLDDQTEN